MLSPVMKKEDEPVDRHDNEKQQHYREYPPDKPGYFIEKAHEYYFMPLLN